MDLSTLLSKVAPTITPTRAAQQRTLTVLSPRLTTVPLPTLQALSVLLQSTDVASLTDEELNFLASLRLLFLDMGGPMSCPPIEGIPYDTNSMRTVTPSPNYLSMVSLSDPSQLILGALTL